MAQLSSPDAIASPTYSFSCPEIARDYMAHPCTHMLSSVTSDTTTSVATEQNRQQVNLPTLMMTPPTSPNATTAANTADAADTTC